MTVTRIEAAGRGFDGCTRQYISACGQPETVNRQQSLVLLFALFLGGAAVVGLFAIEFGASEPVPASFDQTVTVGLSLEHENWLEGERTDVDLPRVQVFYSEYPYVVGYYGVEEFVTTQDERYEQLFGYPLAVYVTTFDGDDLELTADGLPAAEGEYDWISAADAVYVVDSDARTPAGPTVVPFESRTDAEAFTADYGGTVLSWEDVLDSSFDRDDAETVRERVAAQHVDADERVADAKTLRDRPTGAVVGEDAETIQGAIDVAPPETTVLVPEGTYDETIEIDHPITLAGAGNVSIIGDGNSTVVSIEANRTAVLDVSITGVGGDTPGAGATDDHVHGTHSHDHGDSDDGEPWDATIEDDYASGDAGIAVDNSSGVLVDGVTIDTPASGIMLRDSPDAVVSNVSVTGHWDEVNAHMGVVAMRSPVVVERSSFTAGLDGVYTHRADGSVIRDNEMVNNRMGTHLMHTSDTLLANNTIRDQSSTGIFVMTGPERNALVDNEIRASPTGLDVGGSDSYVANNVLVNNTVGFRTDAVATIFEENLVADNRLGASTRSILPTNRVVDNDFVANDQHVRSIGPLRIWTHDGVGNYWEGAVGTPEGGVLDRPYTATDVVDSQLHRVDGTPTIAQAPAIDALDRLEQAVSGLRSGEIRDDAPRCEPVHRDWLEQHGYTVEPDCGLDRSSTEHSANGDT